MVCVCIMYICTCVPERWEELGVEEEEGEGHQVLTLPETQREHRQQSVPST